MSDRAPRRRVLIMGAAGRDFHNFLCCYRDDPQTEVVAFTATQIPSIAGRRFPASLAGPYYPDGIPIYPETALEGVCHDGHPLASLAPQPLHPESLPACASHLRAVALFRASTDLQAWQFAVPTRDGLDGSDDR